MSVWDERTRWNSTVWLDLDKVQHVTGLSTRTIYQYTSSATNDFPAPGRTEGGRNLWAGGHIFRWTIEHRPRRYHSSIPRLLPRIPDPNPARFERTERLTLPDLGRFAVHIWQPSDTGSPIAIAYPDRQARFHPDDAPQIAEDLLHQLPGSIEALAVPSGEATSTTYDPNRHRETAPLIVVAERNTVYQHDPVGRRRSGWRAARYSWFDLANLLRTDVPWWSPLLNELDAMLNWRPGAPAVPITPYAAELDTDNLAALAGTDSSPRVREVAAKLVDRTLLRLGGRQQLHDNNHVTPGLVHAAVNSLDITAPIPVLTPSEAALLLHHRADKHRAQQGIRVINRGDHWAFMPVITHAIRFRRNPKRPMAYHWASGLIDVPEEFRTELGFWYVAEYIGSQSTAVRWMTHPSDPDTWAIEDEEGVIYAGVGTHTPGAAGHAVRAEIELEAAFFEDSAGNIWPIPATGYDYYRTGYHGAGPQRLTETLTLLRADARSDVHEPPSNFNPDTALHELICEQPSPLTITTEMLAAHPY